MFGAKNSSMRTGHGVLTHHLPEDLGRSHVWAGFRVVRGFRLICVDTKERDDEIMTTVRIVTTVA